MRLGQECRGCLEVFSSLLIKFHKALAFVSLQGRCREISASSFCPLLFRAGHGTDPYLVKTWQPRDSSQDVETFKVNDLCADS